MSRTAKSPSAIAAATVDGARSAAAPKPLLAGDVARALGMTRQNLAYHDGELKPTRAPCGCRLYDRALVEQFAKQRARRGRAA